MRPNTLLKVSLFFVTCLFALYSVAQNAPATVAAHADTSFNGAMVNIGYGLQRKSDVNVAIVNLPAGNFNDGAIFNPADQFAGKIAGLAVTEAGGDPNQIASIHLRGQSSFLRSSSPLFVVDGVILADASQFQNIPPGDIMAGWPIIPK